MTKSSDVVFVDDLLAGVFNVILDEYDIDKMYRLQRIEEEEEILFCLKSKERHARHDQTTTLR